MLLNNKEESEAWIKFFAARLTSGTCSVADCADHADAAIQEFRKRIES